MKEMIYSKFGRKGSAFWDNSVKTLINEYMNIKSTNETKMIPHEEEVGVGERATTANSVDMSISVW